MKSIYIQRAALKPLTFLTVIILITGGFPGYGATIDFNRDIRPILSDHCFACHGPDKNKREGGLKENGGLRLDRADGILADLGGYAAVTPGKPKTSELIARISTDNADDIMPPEDFNKPLSKKQRALLSDWVRQGAKYPDHWSFIPLKAEKAPKVSLLQRRWVINDIDRYVLAGLKAQKLKPAADADKRTLIRRLSFDVTGLPPTAAEVQAFLDDKSNDAYEKIVDRLLASPHMGERLATYWLDLVRYADTNGYHADVAWSVSPYRDYVINAFNANMPFDQFTREQLGGDLMPDATIDQRIAAGYNRLNMKSTEFGIQDKEYLAKYASDRVRTTSGTWMGATMGCAECHDHKFDPFSTKDFYRFAAFFADIKQLGYYPGAKWGERFSVPDEQAAKELASATEALTKAQAELKAPRAAWDAEQAVWEAALLTEKDTTAIVLADAHQGPHAWRYTLAKPAADWTTPSFDATSWKTGEGGFGVGEGHLKVRTEWKSKDIWLRTAFELAGKPTKLFVRIQHDDNATVFLNGVEVASVSGWSTGSKDYTVVPVKEKGLAALKTGTNVIAVHCHQNTGGQYLDVGLSNSDSPDKLIAMRALVEKPAETRSAKELATLRDSFRQESPLTKTLRERIETLTTQEKEINARIPTMLATVAVKPMTMRVLARGNWMDTSGEVVLPGVPAFMKQIPTADRATRLDLANWLVDRDNPLTARVFVNRLWKLYFGTGLSRALDDVGAQGEAPSHPELLDMLALEFMDNGWDIKHMIKLLVMSHSYRQSSLARPELADLDPYNRLIARQSRFRLDAEMIRDNALAVSGLLVTDIGGVSVKPYQPEGYWAHLFFPKRTYEQDTGDAQYRRAVYTHWQRQFLHPALKIFDAPSREECTAERPRSNTPLGALVLLNDPSQVEAARVLAAAALGQGGDDAAKLQWLSARVLSRPFKTAELKVLTSFLAEHLEHYRQNPKGAAQLLAIGLQAKSADLADADAAAWTSVTRAILNMHETITRN